MCDGGAQTKGGVGVRGVFACMCTHTHTRGCAIILDMLAVTCKDTLWLFASSVYAVWSCFKGIILTI